MKIKNDNIVIIILCMYKIKDFILKINFIYLIIWKKYR